MEEYNRHARNAGAKEVRIMNRKWSWLFSLVFALLFIGRSTSFADDTTDQTTFQGFSGQTTDYVDSYHGFKIKIPIEFQLTTKGDTMIWTGPMVDGLATTISINTTVMRGVPSKAIYIANLKSKKDDRDITGVVPMGVPILIHDKKKKALAFRCKEAEHKPGTPDKKDAGDIHRWYLYMFGNERSYTCGFTGTYQAFEENKLQSTYDAVIKSIELIPVK